MDELLAELAQATGEAIATLAPACLRVIRRLIAQGFLLPAGLDADGWAPSEHLGP